VRLLRALPFLVVLLLTTAPATDALERVVAILGDSLTSGLGVPAEDAFPARLEALLRREGYDWKVANAGVSGDTSAGGLRRIEWVLKLRPAVVVVALGANDGLRGQPVDGLRDNLTRIVERAEASGARVLLAGMRMPPNYGDQYTRAFAAVYPEVAKATGAALAPFLLEGVAGNPKLNQPDGIHPTAEGHRLIAERLWPHLKPLLVK
jgi:acyl-CoA thioesterase-1